MSIDYYLRLDPGRLAQLRFKHLESQVDPDTLQPAAPRDREGAWLADEIGGYTEWLDAGGVGYSVGWDWFVQTPLGTLAVRPHSIRTNIMLIGPAGEDLGRTRTEEGLERWLAGWDWASGVLQALRTEGHLIATAR